MKRKARRIVVDGQVFAWYTEPFSAALRIYAEKAPGFLEVIFRDGGFALLISMRIPTISIAPP